VRRQTFDREQRLVLLRLDASGVHQAFADIQEAANCKAEVRERLVIDRSWRCVLHTSNIISYYDTYARAESMKMRAIAEQSSQLLAESFLRLDVRVAVALVECVRPVADYVRAQADGVAAVFARPFFRARQ